MSNDEFEVDRFYEFVDPAVRELPGWEAEVEGALRVLRKERYPKDLDYEPIRDHYHRITVWVRSDAVHIRYRILSKDRKIETVEICKIGVGKKAGKWVKELLDYQP